jgi:hypothetical protein
MSDLTWVEQVQTVLAMDFAVVEAINENHGWRLIATGVDHRGQTTLTYGWPWPDNTAADDDEALCEIKDDGIKLWCSTHSIEAESLAGCLAVIF